VKEIALEYIWDGNRAVPPEKERTV
jgi:hypothetical protein